jgi:hypothetical protein
MNETNLDSWILALFGSLHGTLLDAVGHVLLDDEGHYFLFLSKKALRGIVAVDQKSRLGAYFCAVV